MKQTKEINDTKINNANGKMTDTHRKVVSFFGIVIFFAVMIWISYYVGFPLVENIREPENFRKWVEGYGAYGWIVCIGMMVIQIVVAIIPGGVFEIGAGYAYGAIEGGILCIIGSIIGSALVFLFVRYCGIKLVEAFFSVEKIRNLRFLHDERKRNILAFIIFLIPGTPKDLLSYFMGLTEMKLKTWLIISTVARTPAIFISTFSGSALGEKEYMIGIFVLVMLCVGSILGGLIYKKICSEKNN